MEMPAEPLETTLRVNHGVRRTGRVPRVQANSSRKLLHVHPGRRTATDTVSLLQGLAVSHAEVNLADAIARPWTYERDPRGHLGALADTDGRSSSVPGPSGHRRANGSTTAALAVREQIPLDARLRDQVAQFPTYNEGWLQAFTALRS